MKTVIPLTGQVVDESKSSQKLPRRLSEFDRPFVPAVVYVPYLVLGWRTEIPKKRSLRGLDRGKLFVVPGIPYKLVTAIVPKLPAGVRVWMERRSPQSKGRV